MEGGKKESAFQANTGGTTKVQNQGFTYLLLAQRDIQDSPMVVSLELNPEKEHCLAPDTSSIL